ncbi:hypothetical protein MHLP_01375 [Candidatus Mycoplasma haematolamae str. Purdue]|uniref:Uncharacterized protein n=1 Tax=Mycoplasma haematolamae (strain Purdue) TaxID=1212765 RepID=I7B998_MYCHA|nr:hypothetical protein [Candidatus Mycoplasma haematolamae]AFO51855.1 hypothetical protein MHLP_01375 [Candidatus Mycoplasma haematolamae str. Purdue]
MIVGSIVKGVFGLSAIGGVGAAGVMWGPELATHAKTYLTMFKEAGKGQGIKFTIKAPLGNSAVLDCAGQTNQHTSLKLEKTSDSSSKAKFSCQNTSEPLGKAESLFKYAGELTCFRTNSMGTEQTFTCLVKNKTLTLTEGQKTQEKVTEVTANWT